MDLDMLRPIEIANRYRKDNIPHAFRRFRVQKSNKISMASHGVTRIKRQETLMIVEPIFAASLARFRNGQGSLVCSAALA